MDDLTGATSWRGKTLALPGAERELLGVFVRRAGDRAQSMQKRSSIEAGH